MAGNRFNYTNDDPSNPLRALLAGRPLWGNAGGHLFDGQPGTHVQMESQNAGQAQDILTRDPRYYNRTISAGSEAGGGEERFGLNDTAQKSFRRNGETWTQLRNLEVGGDANNVIDPALVEYDPEFGLMTPASNIQRDVNAEGGDLATFIIGGAALGGAAAGHMAAGAGGGAAGAGGTAFETLPNLTMPEMASFGPDFAMGGAAAPAGGGGLGGLGEQAINYETLPNLQMPPSAQFPSDPSMLSRAGTWAMNNPGTVARGALGLAALGAGASGKDSGGGGSSSDAQSIIEQMANANRVDHTTPLGSRKWSQGPDGRWSVNDAMDPAEEANFKNVQGMNSSITDMARQRLAALLAAPPRQRADRPLSVAGFNIGG